MKGKLAAIALTSLLMGCTSFATRGIVYYPPKPRPQFLPAEEAKPTIEPYAFADDSSLGVGAPLGEIDVRLGYEVLEKMFKFSLVYKLNRK